MVRTRTIVLCNLASLMVISVYIYVHVEVFLDRDYVNRYRAAAAASDMPPIGGPGSDDLAGDPAKSRVDYVESDSVIIVKLPDDERLVGSRQGHGENAGSKDPHPQGFMDRKRQLVTSQNSVYVIPEVPPLPVCPSGVKLNLDNRALSILQLCSPKGSLNFDPILEIWRYTAHGACAGRFVAYNREAALVRNVIVDKRFAVGNLFNQSKEEDEYYGIQPGLFRLQCEEVPKVRIRGDWPNHVAKWLTSSVTYNGSALVDDVISDFTVAITRYEHHNIYHTLTDLFNVFLALKYFNLNPSDVRVLLVDAHPVSLVAPLYDTLFKSTVQLHELKDVTLFKQLFWNVLGSQSLFLDHSRNALPYTDEFRQFILDRYNLTQYSPLICTAPSITLISRKDYFATRTNPSGVLQRKFYNADELIATLKSAYPRSRINHAFLEDVRLDDQLRLITRTDILIGMHGAGLTHALLLPPHAGVIEFIPEYWRNADRHFMGICRWRNLRYIRWRNEDRANEFDNYQTRIPPQVLRDKMSEMLDAMCPKPKQADI